MTALEEVKRLLALVDKEAEEHDGDYDFLWGIIQDAVYCQSIIDMIVWRCNRVNNPGLQSPKEYVSVIHCKDCKWAEEAIFGEIVECTMPHTFPMKHGYCHHGERREHETD